MDGLGAGLSMFHLARFIHICSNELTPMNNVTKLFSCCRTFVHQKKIMLNQNFLTGFEGTHGYNIYKSVISRLLILVVESQKKIYMYRRGVKNSGPFWILLDPLDAEAE